MTSHSREGVFRSFSRGAEFRKYGRRSIIFVPVSTTHKHCSSRGAGTVKSYSHHTSRVSLGRRRGLATWSSSHLHWQMSVKSNSFQPCRASEICFTLTIIAVRRPLIIKYSSTYHSLLVVGVFGVWGFGVMGLSSLLAGCHLLVWRE